MAGVGLSSPSTKSSFHHKERLFQIRVQETMNHSHRILEMKDLRNAASRSPDLWASHASPSVLQALDRALPMASDQPPDASLLPAFSLMRVRSIAQSMASTSTDFLQHCSWAWWPHYRPCGHSTLCHCSCTLAQLLPHRESPLLLCTPFSADPLILLNCLALAPSSALLPGLGPSQCCF